MIRFALAVLCLILTGASPALALEPIELPLDLGIHEKLGERIPLDLTFRDEAGEPVVLGSLLGKPTVLSLVYFRCAGICSPLLNGVVDVLKKSDLEPGEDVQILTVSFDSRDTPEVAAAKKANYLKQLRPDFPEAGWRFLTGEASASKQLADAVGFDFKKVGEDYVHPGALFVLSPTGKIARYMHGLTFLPLDLKMALVEASEERTGPTINKLLKFCFSYDPEGRRYFLNVTRIGGLMTVVLVLAFAVGLWSRGRPMKTTGAPT